jgi:branched-chain amino acid transport system substrate-binding protein
MSQKNETPALILSLLITLGLIGGGAWWFFNRGGGSVPGGLVGQSSGRIEDRLSVGNRILVAADTNSDKQAGVQAIAANDFSAAISHFQASLQANRNDPEALIYLNNAKAAAGGKILKIAVSVPIGSNLNVAKEVLRGVAQAQNEVNLAGGINGSLVQVAIANDDNNPDIVKQTAENFVKDPSILAVIGHNSSEASLKAAPIYQQGGLVMVSPTSDAKTLSGIGSYIFRTVPNVRFTADNLSRYAAQAGKKNILVCADSQASSSQALKEEFTSAVFADGGRINSTACDFSAGNFNAPEILSQATGAGADAILLAPSVDRQNQAIATAKANQGRLSLLGSSTLYTFSTLQQGQSNVNDMVLAVAWHPQSFPGNPFPGNAVKLWGGEVNWRSAIAYDATQAILQGLRDSQDSSRTGVQKALASSGFAAEGATGEVRFLPSGDREAPTVLVRVQPGKSSGTGYDFVPIP